MKSEFDCMDAALGKHSDKGDAASPKLEPPAKSPAPPVVPAADWNSREAFLIEQVGITNAITLMEADQPEAIARFKRFEKFIEIDESNRSWSWNGDPGATVVALVAKCLDATADKAADYLEQFIKSNPDCLELLHPDGQPDKFPVDCLPKVLRTVVDTIMKIHGAPAQLPAALAIGAISAALGKGIKLNSVRGLSVYGNTYIVGAGRSGTGKSVVALLIFKAIYDYENHLKKLHAANVNKITSRLSEIRDEILDLEAENQNITQ